MFLETKICILCWRDIKKRGCAITGFHCIHYADNGSCTASIEFIAVRALVILPAVQARYGSKQPDVSTRLFVCLLNFCLAHTIALVSLHARSLIREFVKNWIKCLNLALGCFEPKCSRRKFSCFLCREHD